MNKEYITLLLTTMNLLQRGHPDKMCDNAISPTFAGYYLKRKIACPCAFQNNFQKTLSSLPERLLASFKRRLMMLQK